MQITLGGNVVASATERWLTELRAGRAYSYARRSVPSLGQLAHVQLFNPAGSGKVILIRKLLTGLSGTDQILLNTYNTALTTLDGNGRNLLSGSANGSGQVREQSNATALGSLLNHWPAQGLALIDALPEWGMELGEGEGLLITTSAVDTVIYGNWWWVELT